MEEMIVGAFILLIGTLLGAFCHSAGISAGNRTRKEK